jgi:hypothetical protein
MRIPSLSSTRRVLAAIASEIFDTLSKSTVKARSTPERSSDIPRSPPAPLGPADEDVRAMGTSAFPFWFGNTGGR